MSDFEKKQILEAIKKDTSKIENNVHWVETKLDDLIKLIEKQNELLEQLVKK